MPVKVQQGINFIAEIGKVSCRVRNDVFDDEMKLTCWLPDAEPYDLLFKSIAELKLFLIQQTEVNNTILAELGK